MKRISNNILALLALIFIITAFGMNYMFYKSLTIPTGKVTSEIRLCINHPPSLNMICDSEVNFDQAYFCDIDALDQEGNTLTFYDNTSLFNIGLSTGIISFTPRAPKVGTHAINISVQDDSVCANNVTYATLNITVLGGFTQVIVNTTANTTTTIDETEEADTELEIVTASDVSNASLNISKGSVNPTSQDLGVPELDKYLVINASQELEANITSNLIRIFYTAAELTSSQLHEQSLNMYNFNQSWLRVANNLDWVFQTGLNTTDQGDYSGYVWANISHLSIYSVGGLLVDGAACSQASECYGGYCCSSVCSSSRCPVTETPSGGGGGGGGGGGVSIKKIEEKKFILSTDIKHISLEQGQTKRTSFSVFNNEKHPLTFSINLGNLKKFVLIGANNFELQPGEEKSIILDFIAPLTQEPGLYSEAIIVTGGEFVKLIRVFFEVESRAPLFDISLELMLTKIYQGGKLDAIATIFNMKDIGKVDVLLETQIRDVEGKVFYAVSETLAVRERTSVVISFNVPEDIEPGIYVLYSKVTYGETQGSSSEMFNIIKRPLIEMPGIVSGQPSSIIILVIAQITFTIIIFVLLLYVLGKGFVKAREGSEKAVEKEEKQEESRVGHDIAVLEGGHRVYELKNKLEERLKFIEESFRSNLMSEETYLKEKKRIKEHLEKLRNSMHNR